MTPPNEPDPAPGAQAERPCYACAAGVVRQTNIHGRPFDYRGTAVVLDRDLVVPVCDACGEMRLGSENIRQLNASLERLRAAALGQQGLEQTDTVGEADEALVAEVRRRAEEALGDREKAHRWLATANRALGGRTPQEMLATAEGAQVVCDILTRIEHGIVG